MTIALIGYGAIGKAIAEILSSECGNCFVLGAFTRRGIAGPLRAFASLHEMLEAKPKIVIEVAGQDALRAYGAEILAAGVSLIPASIGALADESFYRALTVAGRRGRSHLIVSAGALAGLDGLCGGRLLGLHEVVYRGASPSPLYPSEPPDAKGLIFKGYAREAALRYPTRANVTAAVALAGIGFDRTVVELFFDPSLAEARHEVEAKGTFGEFRVRMKGLLLPGGRASRPIAGNLAHTALRTLQLQKADGSIVL